MADGGEFSPRNGLGVGRVDERSVVVSLVISLLTRIGVGDSVRAGLLSNDAEK